ncbi:MAG: sodium-dependent transporter [Kiritimatiellia bacterium]|jgi:NSS family neurotransmitter:Na+ symporter
MDTSNTRAKWSGQLAFVLAGAASAVGLGNLWRFPYLAAKYGGGIFLLTYLVLVFTFGFSLMVAEVAIGRRTGLSGLAAFKALDRRFGFLGWLVTAIPVIILPYYCVIGGWVGRYFVGYGLSLVKTGVIADPAGDTFFQAFVTHPALPLQYAIFFIALTFFVVALGVKHGIERANMIMMPLLLLGMLALIGFTLTRPGSAEGIAFYLKPDFAKFSFKTVLGAMGQMFYSLSLAMGIMITYGSYMRKADNIERSSRHIAAFDTLVSVLAGMLVIPAIFIFSGGKADAMQSGPGLMFQTLPKVFAGMPGGDLTGFVFFTLVLFAALTSSISLMETIVASIQDALRLDRLQAASITFVATILLAVPSAFGYGRWSHITPFRDMPFLDFFDFISNSVLMPTAAFLTCIFVGWVVGPKVVIDEASIPTPFRRRRLFVAMIRYIAPILILGILVSSILTALNIIVI